LNSDLPPPTNKYQIEAAQEAVRELVLESRSFVTLLGDVRPDGTREPGVIERESRLLGIEDGAKREYIRSIVEKAATLVDDEGDTPAAVLLYHLSEDYSLVLATINRRLSDVFLDTSSPVYANDLAAQEEAKKMNFSMAAQADPASLASNILAMYEASGNILARLDNRERETCKVLLGMIEARKAFLAGRWEASVSVTPLYGGSHVDDRRFRSDSLVWIAIYAQAIYTKRSDAERCSRKEHFWCIGHGDASAR
jgi:nuclear pore complex protein Nup93